jgi:pyruvate dehydrogenase E1 component alpha subunit
VTEENLAEKGASKGVLSQSDLRELYTKMLRIRLFNERQAEEARRGEIFGYLHLYTGMEAVAVGTISVLQPGDKITSTHRAEGHFIAAGVPIKEIMAECFGRVTGVCGGRGGPMGLAAMEAGLISAYEVVGGGIALATGVAWAFKKQELPNIVLCIFGDGAANQGVLYECMNMAALWRLPVVYVCENNSYAVDTSIERAFAVPDIASRANGFGLPGVTVDGTDVLEVLRVTQKATARARSGEGPTFLEVVAPRWCGHHQADPQWYYRSREEVEAQRKNDPIQRLQDMLISKSFLNTEDDEALHNQIMEEIEEAVRFAADSPWPEEKGMFKNLFVESSPN